MKTKQLLQFTAAILLAALLGQPRQAHAEIINFESIPGTVPSDLLAITTQFEATLGVTFSMVDNATGLPVGIAPLLAMVGTPVFGGPATAFQRDDGVDILPDSPADAALSGSFFLTDETTNIFATVTPHDIVVTFSTPVASASGIILDIDSSASHNEGWEVQARDNAGAVIAQVVLGHNAIDGGASEWAFQHGATDNIYSIRFHYTGAPTKPVGFALDNIQFHRCARPALTQVALKGDVAPGTGGAQWKVFSVPAINFAGNNAFRATLGGAGVSASNDLGIWAGAGLPLVIRKGDAAPCVTGALFRDFSSPVLNDLDQVAFRGLMKIGSGGVIADDDAGVWTNSVPSGLPTLIAREYVAYPVCGFPPCVPVGAKYKKITSIAMPNGGGVAFTATLVLDAAAGVTSTNDFGLWHSDASGEVDLLLRKGDVMMVNGINRTVSGITVLSVNVPYVSGTGRTLERTGGTITCRITFSGSPSLEGIFNL